MPSYKSHGYKCGPCGGHETIELVDRNEEPPATFPCEVCGEPAQLSVGATIMVAALPDGTKRWEHIKSRRVLEKAGKKALRQGKLDDAGRIGRELSKHK